MARDKKFYDDDFSREVFDLFEQYYYPEDVVKILGGTKKEYSYMYQYWMDQKRKHVAPDKRVEFVINFEGYPSEFKTGVIEKVYENSVLVLLDEPCSDEELAKRVKNRVVMSIKDILYIEK